MHRQTDRKSLEEAEYTNWEPQRPAAHGFETRCSLCPQLLHLSLAVSSQIEASISPSIGGRKWKLGGERLMPGGVSALPPPVTGCKSSNLTAGRHL